MTDGWRLAGQVFGLLLLSVVTVILFIPLVILRGWALSVLWGWFVVPMGLPPLGIAHAIGLAIVFGLMIYHYESSTDKKSWGPLAHILLQPVLAVGIGWIVKGYL